jgi:hypothetical protein
VAAGADRFPGVVGGVVSPEGDTETEVLFVIPDAVAVICTEVAVVAEFT